MTTGANFGPRTQNEEAKRYKIYSLGGDLAPCICAPLSHPTFYISIVLNKCMFPLGFPTKTLYAIIEMPVTGNDNCADLHPHSVN